MFNDETEQIKYIIENYPEITDSRIDSEHWDIFCTRCKIVLGFQVISTDTVERGSSYSSTYGIKKLSPYSIFFRCPICNAYKQWIVYNVQELEQAGDKKIWVDRIYRIGSIPGEGSEEIDEIPTDPPSLRTSYIQAIRAMDANAHIAAAAMFRRALQVITREILGATPGNLANELEEVVGKEFNGETITRDFREIGYIIKEAGNQGAHPDKDPDLLNFSSQDAQDLQKVFMEIVSDLFIIPKAKKKAREDFLKRRKIEP